MATDNTTLNPGSSGDVIRTVAKTVNSGSGAKTQIGIIDVGGGADGSPETPLTLGQATSANSLPVVIASDQFVNTQLANGTIDSGNSSTAVLGANATFTGTAFDAYNMTTAQISVSSDQNSAANGFIVEWSSDGTHWDEQGINTYISAEDAGGSESLQISHRLRYFRIVYTNGSVAQTYFRLAVIHKIGSAFGTVREVNDIPSTSDHAQLTYSVTAGVDNVTGTTLRPVNAILIETGQNALMVGLAATNFFSSTNNSSASQLAAGATFTGTIESILNQPLASIMLVADQPITITIYQSIDAGGVFQVKPIVIIVPAGTTINRGITVNGNYFWVSAKNTGTATTTTFNLNVAYGNENPVTENANVPIQAKGQISQSNSSSTPLAAGVSFIGSADPVSDYSCVAVQVYSDQPGVLTYYWSIDGVHWDDSASFNVTGGMNLNVETSPQAPYFYVGYTNNANTAQTVFRLGIMYQLSSPGGDVISIDQPISQYQNAQITMGALFDPQTPSNQGRIKAGGVGATAADPALVVAISPNSREVSNSTEFSLLQQILATMEAIRRMIADSSTSRVTAEDVINDGSTINNL